MGKTKKQDLNWVQMLQSHSQTCRQVRAHLEELEEVLETGDDAATAIRRLGGIVREMCREADQLAYVLHEEPVRRIFSADRLNITEQQFLLARAAGLDCFTAKSVGVSPITDYEAYRLCVYEDDEMVWFLHPDEPLPSPPRHEGNTEFVRAKAALSPEEVDVAHLRPEQIEFFTKYRPDILPRLGLLKKQDRREQSEKDVAAPPQGRE